jgi:hypothetical protein
MQTSKGFLGIFLCLQLLWLAACNLPEPQRRNDGLTDDNANFVIADVRGDATIENTGPDFVVPKDRTFSFIVCLKDSARSKDLVGHSFRIEETGQEIRTDARGCLNWSEKVVFKFFGEAKYLQWDRRITATGVYRGSRVAHLAINPWNMIDRSAAVLNLDTNTTPNLISGADAVKLALAGGPVTPGSTGKNAATWFTLGEAKENFLRVTKETTSDREISFKTITCLKTGAINKNFRNYQFKVTGFHAEGKTGKTYSVNPDNEGCLKWDDVIQFKYNECQQYMKGSIRIENAELSMNQSIDLALNPWETFGDSFGRDLRYAKQTENILTDCKKEKLLPPTLLVTKYSYTKQSFDYTVDDALNLTYKKKVRMNLDARTVSYGDMLKGRMDAAQRIRPGVYLLKVAVIKNKDYYNDKTYVTSAEQLVATLDGDLVVDLEFASADLKAMGNTNTLLVELDPVSESKATVASDGSIQVKEAVTNLDELIDSQNGLKTLPVTGVITMALDRDAQDLRPLDPKALRDYLVNAELPPEKPVKSVVREYIELGAKIAAERTQSLQRQSDTRAFAKQNSLDIVNLNDPQTLLGLTRNLTAPPLTLNAPEFGRQLKNLAVNGVIDGKLHESLCHYWFSDLLRDALVKKNSAADPSLGICRNASRNGFSMFLVDKRLFVQKLGAQEFVKGVPQAVSIGNGITLTNTHSVSHIVTRAVNLSTGLSLKFSEIFSVGVSGSYNIAHQTSDQVANNNSTTLGVASYVNLQVNSFRLRFDRYQECAIVKINPMYFTQGPLEKLLSPQKSIEDKAAALSRGLMVCTGVANTKPITRMENYYVLTQDMPNSGSNDAGDERNRNFFIALRGDNEFQRLLYFMKGEMKAAPASGDKIQPTGNDSLLKLFNTGLPVIPGSYHDAQGMR